MAKMASGVNEKKWQPAAAAKRRRQYVAENDLEKGSEIGNAMAMAIMKAKKRQRHRNENGENQRNEMAKAAARRKQ
jgi:hypothetical protein